MRHCHCLVSAQMESSLEEVQVSCSREVNLATAAAAAACGQTLTCSWLPTGTCPLTLIYFRLIIIARLYFKQEKYDAPYLKQYDSLKQRKRMWMVDGANHSAEASRGGEPVSLVATPSQLWTTFLGGLFSQQMEKGWKKFTSTGRQVGQYIPSLWKCWISLHGNPSRYLLNIHFFIESSQKMIQFNIPFETEYKISIQKNNKIPNYPFKENTHSSEKRDYYPGLRTTIAQKTAFFT